MASKINICGGIVVAVKPHYASVKNPTIEAAMNGLFRFKNESQAQDRLQSIRDFFVISRNKSDGASDAQLILWVNGYSLTKDETSKGFIGNYAIIHTEKTEDGKYTLKTKKLESDLKYHPQRKRIIHKHPNWGHPILRSIKKGKIFGDIEVARNELLRLHEEYPEISIPCTNKMYIIIYGKVPGSKSPVQKYVLEIKVSDGGGYYVEYKTNSYKTPYSPPKRTTSATKDVPKGYFTSMIDMKRKKK